MDLKLFVDTMEYLHFRPLDELDLPGLTGADSVTVVIPRITIRELDKHKSSHPIRAIRDRAKRVLAEIERAIKIGGAQKRKIGIEYFDVNPKDELEEFDLNPEWADDVLIASILAYTKNTGDANVALLTQDTGPRLSCHRLDIKAFELTEDLRLPEELNETEKENRALRQQLAQVTQLRPILSFGFAGQPEIESFARFSVQRPDDVDEEKISRIVQEIRDKYPRRLVDENERRMAYLVGLASTGEGPQQWDEYNERLESFYLEVEEHHRAIHKFNQAHRLRISFSGLIRNTGNAPAIDVDVLLRIPKPLNVYPEDGLPEEPEEPTPPRKPKSRFEEITLGALSRQYYPGALAPYLDLLGKPSTFEIRKVQEFNLVSDHFDRIKHGTTVNFPTIYIEFPSFEEACSFHVQYEIRPANTAAPFIGEMHFVLDKQAS
jgi:hypothetical protein